MESKRPKARESTKTLLLNTPSLPPPEEAILASGGGGAASTGPKTKEPWVAFFIFPIYIPFANQAILLVLLSSTTNRLVVALLIVVSAPGYDPFAYNRAVR
jgi:hypothetical protein